MSCSASSLTSFSEKGQPQWRTNATRVGCPLPLARSIPLIGAGARAPSPGTGETSGDDRGSTDWITGIQEERYAVILRLIHRVLYCMRIGILWDRCSSFAVWGNPVCVCQLSALRVAVCMQIGGSRVSGHVHASHLYL